MASYLLLGLLDREKQSTPTPSRKKIFRDRTSQLDTLDDAQLISRYRLNRHAIMQIIASVGSYLERPTKRSVPLSPEMHVLVTLRYLAKGGFQSEIGDLHGVSQPSVSRAIHRTINLLCKHLNLIHFPNDATTRQNTKERFYDIAGFPNVIGCIDGTLIAIIRPPHDEEVAYVCRKGYHAINIQAICDADLRFTNIVCRWPGATHDAFMLSNSTIGTKLEQNPVDGWLLGDSGYACRPWLLTPLSNPQTPPEEKYNRAHCRTRNTVERAFGVLKSRFRCLGKTTGCLMFTSKRCHQVVYAAAQLHNMCLDMNIPLPPSQADEVASDDTVYHGPICDGFQTRRGVIRQFFSRQ